MINREFFDSIAAAMEIPDAFMYGVADATFAVFKEPFAIFEAGMNAFLPGPTTWLRSYIDSQRFESQKPLPLSDPIVGLFAVFSYFLTLVVLHLVSKVIGKRKYTLIGTIHNTFLFLLSLFMAFGFLTTVLAHLPMVWGNPAEVDPEQPNRWRLAKLMWIFTASKLPEYGDTFLMVLKQNHHQITFLHLYHHTSIFVFCWFCHVVAPGGDCYWPQMLNSFVHIFMYGYYAGTLIFSEGPVRRFLNSIKFMITKGQLTQFSLNLAHTAFLLSQGSACKVHNHVVIFQTFYMSSMLGLFGNFLLKNQGKSKSTAHGKGKPARAGATDPQSKKRR